MRLIKSTKSKFHLILLYRSNMREPCSLYFDLMKFSSDLFVGILQNYRHPKRSLSSDLLKPKNIIGGFSDLFISDTQD